MGVTGRIELNANSVQFQLKLPTETELGNNVITIKTQNSSTNFGSGVK